MNTRFASRVALLALAAIPVSLAAAGTPPAGEIAEGKRLYIASGCSFCHGTSGQGGTSVGPSLAPNVAPLELFQVQLRTPANRMPRYSKIVLSDAQITNIVEYLASIPPGKPAPQIWLIAGQSNAAAHQSGRAH